MGAAPSAGRSNDELIDCLVDNSYIRFRSSEFAFRVVDRGDYFPTDKRDKAYTDQAWKSDDGGPGFIHLSAPCIYANALEYLDLRPGLSFLNVGSGTGYFNAVAGFLLTETGTNHGVEMYENLVEYAEQTLQNTLNRSATSAFSFCVPEFFVGSAFYIQNCLEAYDRIYVGALVPKNRRYYFCSMLKVGGVLIMPYGSKLLQIIRKDRNQFLCYQISNVSFSQLVAPLADSPRTNQPVKLSQPNIPSLMELCRIVIRTCIRQNLFTKQPIQMQFEIGLTKDSNSEEDSEERQMERIGTLYLMGRRVRDQPQQPGQNVPQPQQQEDQDEEQLFENPAPANEGDETPEAIRNLLHTPPLVNELHEGEARPHDNFEVWTPPERRAGNEELDDPMNVIDQPAIRPDQIPMEDGIDAEAMALHAANQDDGHGQEDENVPQEQQEPQRRRRFALHVNANQQDAAAMARRQRLHVNLINGNRLVGFLNHEDDEEEEEDLFREADNRREPTEPLGLAANDRTTSAVFHTTDVRPNIDTVDMTQLIPNYKAPRRKPLRTKSVGSGDVRDASTATDDIQRPPRFSLRFAMRPGMRVAGNGNLIGRFTAAVQPFAQRQQQQNQQPTTSFASTETAQQTSATISTQTEEGETLREAPVQEPQQPNYQRIQHRLAAARQIVHGIHQNMETINQRQQRIRQLFDRMQRFTNAVPQQLNPSNQSTTAATAASSSASATTSSGRSGLKRRLEDETEVHSENAVDFQMKAESDSDSATSTHPKISRSASLPDCSQEQVNTVELMSSLRPQPQQSQSSSLRPDSPMPSSSMSIADPPSPLSTVSSSASSAPTTNTTSTSGQASDVLSDATSGDLSSIAGGSTASSSAPTAATMDTSSGFATDDQQEQNAEDTKRQNERAERSRLYKKQMDEFHAEYQRRLKSLPMSERLIHFVCYEN